MCNACGFGCCAYDGFSECGCDDCPEPKCWSAEAFEGEFGLGDDVEAEEDKRFNREGYE